VRRVPANERSTCSVARISVGMVAVIVEHGHAGLLALLLEAAVDALERREPLADRGARDLELESHGDRGQRVLHVVAARARSARSCRARGRRR
jgi:hypothetical protein